MSVSEPEKNLIDRIIRSLEEGELEARALEAPEKKEKIVIFYSSSVFDGSVEDGQRLIP